MPGGALGYRVVDASLNPYSYIVEVRMTVELPGGALAETSSLHSFRLFGPAESDAALEFAVLDAKARALVDD